MDVARDDLELELLVARMDRRELDLRSDRSADEEWDRPRQQRLIDTILRGWCVPPVHLGDAGPAEPEVVLDGGQRLHTIAQFLRDELACPDGLRFSELPVEVRRRVRRFRLPVVTLSGYHAAELAELFDRLHEPSRAVVPAVPAPSTEPAPGTHRAPGSSEPIFDQVSAWFADLSDFWGLSTFDDRSWLSSWSSPADAGHDAARAAVDPPDAGVTDAGLPQREPLAQLAPGAVGTPGASDPRSDAPSGPAPEDVGDRLASYWDGVAEGRGDRRGDAVPEPIRHSIFDDHR
ncbi:DUF262 domain-containing protein [Actinomycetospora sp. NBC_00405]|uniref:DUF262 domain-containing protein n=1 Tax=Actinomycetospora sp. NBC_00405 TaxID=2975952 RepID=UPI002E1AD970